MGRRLMLSLTVFVCGIEALSIHPSGPLMCAQLGQAADNGSSYQAHNLTCSLQSFANDRMFTEKGESFYSRQCRKESGGTRKQRVMNCMMVSRLQTAKRLLKHGNTMMINGRTIQCKKTKEQYKPKRCSSSLGKNNLSVKDILHCVVDNHEDINCEGSDFETPLLDTVGFGDRKEEEFDLLMCLGADPNARTIMKSNSILIAASKGARKIVEKLVRFGVDLESRSNDQGKTVALTAAGKGHIEVVLYLIGVGCNVNAVTWDEFRNILHLLYSWQLKHASTVNVTVIKRLLEANFSTSNLMSKDRHTGKSPLLYAARFCDLESVKLLVQNGCKISDTDNGKNNILHFASRCCSVEMVKFIVDLNQVDANARNRQGMTSLQEAKDSLCSSEIMSLLGQDFLQHGLSFDFRETSQ